MSEAASHSPVSSTCGTAAPSNTWHGSNGEPTEWSPPSDDKDDSEDVEESEEAGEVGNVWR